MIICIAPIFYAGSFDWLFVSGLTALSEVFQSISGRLPERERVKERERYIEREIEIEKRREGEMLKHPQPHLLLAVGPCPSPIQTSQ